MSTERGKYIQRIFLVLISWLVIVFVIVILQGFGLMNLSDTVLIALITKTTISIVTIPVVITKYLFPNK